MSAGGTGIIPGGGSSESSAGSGSATGGAGYASGDSSSPAGGSEHDYDLESDVIFGGGGTTFYDDVQVGGPDIAEFATPDIQNYESMEARRAFLESQAGEISDVGEGGSPGYSQPGGAVSPAGVADQEVGAPGSGVYTPGMVAPVGESAGPQAQAQAPGAASFQPRMPEDSSEEVAGTRFKPGDAVPVAARRPFGSVGSQPIDGSIREPRPAAEEASRPFKLGPSTVAVEASPQAPGSGVAIQGSLTKSASPALGYGLTEGSLAEPQLGQGGLSIATDGQVQAPSGQPASFGPSPQASFAVQSDTDAASGQIESAGFPTSDSGRGPGVPTPGYSKEHPTALQPDHEGSAAVSAGGQVPVGLRTPFGDTLSGSRISLTEQITGFDPAWGEPPKTIDSPALEWNPFRFVYELRNVGPGYGTPARRIYDAHAALEERGIHYQAFHATPGEVDWRYRWVRVPTPFPEVGHPYTIIEEMDPGWNPASESADPVSVSSMDESSWDLSGSNGAFAGIVPADSGEMFPPLPDVSVDPTEQPTVTDVYDSLVAGAVPDLETKEAFEFMDLAGAVPVIDPTGQEVSPHEEFAGSYDLDGLGAEGSQAHESILDAVAHADWVIDGSASSTTSMADYAWVDYLDLPVGCPYPYAYMPVPLDDFTSGYWLEPDYVPSIPLPPPYDEIPWQCGVPATGPTQEKGKKGEPPPPIAPKPPSELHMWLRSQLKPRMRYDAETEEAIKNDPAVQKEEEALAKLEADWAAAMQAGVPNIVKEIENQMVQQMAALQGAEERAAVSFNKKRAADLDKKIKDLEYKHHITSDPKRRERIQKEINDAKAWKDYSQAVMGHAGKVLRSIPENDQRVGNLLPPDERTPSDQVLSQTGPVWDEPTDAAVEVDPAVQREKEKLDKLSEDAADLDRRIENAPAGSWQETHLKKERARLGHKIGAQQTKVGVSKVKAAERFNEKRRAELKKLINDLTYQKSITWDAKRRDAIQAEINDQGRRLDDTRALLVLIREDLVTMSATETGSSANGVGPLAIGPTVSFQYDARTLQGKAERRAAYAKMSDAELKGLELKLHDQLVDKTRLRDAEHAQELYRELELVSAELKNRGITDRYGQGTGVKALPWDRGDPVPAPGIAGASLEDDPTEPEYITELRGRLERWRGQLSRVSDEALRLRAREWIALLRGLLQQWDDEKVLLATLEDQDFRKHHKARHLAMSKVTLYERFLSNLEVDHRAGQVEEDTYDTNKKKLEAFIKAQKASVLRHAKAMASSSKAGDRYKGPLREGDPGSGVTKDEVERKWGNREKQRGRLSKEAALRELLTEYSILRADRAAGRASRQHMTAWVNRFRLEWNRRPDTKPFIPAGPPVLITLRHEKDGKTVTEQFYVSVLVENIGFFDNDVSVWKNTGGEIEADKYDKSRMPVALLVAHSVNAIGEFPDTVGLMEVQSVLDGKAIVGDIGKDQPKGPGKPGTKTVRLKVDKDHANGIVRVGDSALRIGSGKDKLNDQVLLTVNPGTAALDETNAGLDELTTRVWRLQLFHGGVDRPSPLPEFGIMSGKVPGALLVGGAGESKSHKEEDAHLGTLVLGR